MENNTVRISKTQKEKFKKDIWATYKKIKRDSLPWRKTKDPYKILVSEVMLQQTQVNRVIQKYTEFLKLFPTIQSLAEANQTDVIRAWQGLGYNRRALYLKKTAETLVQKKSSFPKDLTELIKLTGIGQSTAGALMNFSFNIPTPFIETNIRAVYLHYFFSKNSDISDTDILSIVTETMDHKNPREWFYALYDYGSELKTKLGKKKTELHKKSKSYTKQSKFEGSDRQIRGAVLRAILSIESKSKNKKITQSKIASGKEISKIPPEKLAKILEGLCKDGFMRQTPKPGIFDIL